jgi:KaiC/GvpD/RAD55 family RecA-like ATPase
MALTAASAGIPSGSLAQQDDPPTAATATKGAKPRGRLPVYYVRVVTQEQREKIYSLQAKFQTDIDRLLIELKKIERQRDLEVRGVLKPEQQEKVDEWVAEAKAKREQRRKANSTSQKATQPAPQR